MTGVALLVACCSIIALPLGNGFISEWLTFRSFLAGSTMNRMAPALVLPLMAGVLALMGGIAAACFAKLYSAAFLGRPHTPEAEQAHEVPMAMRSGMAALAAACLILGIAPGLMLRPIAATVQTLLPGAVAPAEAFAVTRVIPWLALVLVVAVAAVAMVRRMTRVTVTWGCGLPGLNERMQYTSTAFSKPVRKVFAAVYRPERTVEVTPANQPYFPATMTYRSVRTTSFERSLYRPAVDAIVGAAYRLRELQTGNIQIYLLYIFVALIALLVFMRFA
jgi:hydrogenase-4 component B